MSEKFTFAHGEIVLSN